MSRVFKTSGGGRAAEQWPFPNASDHVLPIADPATGASYTLSGAVTYTLSPAAAFDFDNQSVISGAVTYTLSPAAAFDFDNQSVISGDVTYTLSPAAAFAYTPAGGASYTLSGAVTYTLSPAAAFDFDNQSVISGDVTYTLSPAAAFAYAPFAVPVPTPFLGTTFEIAHVEQYGPRTRKPRKRKPVEVSLVLPLEWVAESDANDLEDLLAMLEAA